MDTETKEKILQAMRQWEYTVVMARYPVEGDAILSVSRALGKHRVVFGWMLRDRAVISVDADDVTSEEAFAALNRRLGEV
jgi:hypothetical protein